MENVSNWKKIQDLHTEINERLREYGNVSIKLPKIPGQFGTKNDSLRRLERSGKMAAVAQSVIDVVKVSPMSRREISRVTGHRLSSICGRVKELIDEGVLHVVGTKFDDETERNVEIVEMRGV